MRLAIKKWPYISATNFPSRQESFLLTHEAKQPSVMTLGIRLLLKHTKDHLDACVVVYVRGTRLSPTQS